MTAADVRSVSASPRTIRSGRSLALGLGWFSIGLGVFELLRSRSMARSLGLGDHGGLVRLYGMREITAGVGLLLAEDKRPWLAARIAGDGLDAATLTTGLVGSRPPVGNILIAMIAAAGITALDIACLDSAERDHRE